MILDTDEERKNLKKLGFSDNSVDRMIQSYAHMKNGELIATKADLKTEIDRIESIMKSDRLLIVGVFLMLLWLFIKTIIN